MEKAVFKTICISKANYEWLNGQRFKTGPKEYESFNDVIDRMRKQRGKD